jgi:hypothetical protein
MKHIFTLSLTRNWLKIKISTAILCFSILVIPQISLASSTQDAESIFDNFLLPMQLSAIDEIHKVLGDKPELKDGLYFLKKIDLPSILKANRAAMIDIIKDNLSKKELSYLNKYITQPEVKKYLSLAMENKNFEKALTMLSDEEKAIVNIKNPEFEASIAPKFQKMNAQIKSMIAYGGIDAIEKHKDDMEKIRPIDETCQMAHDIARYNTSFLACGLGYRLGYKISSKIFAKMMWRGDYLEKDIPQALAIYKQLLSQETDPEVAFYYGVLNFNMTADKETKRTAACWIKLSSSKIYNNAVGFYNDIKDDYPDLPNHCQFISNN